MDAGARSHFGLLSDWNGEAVHGFGIATEFRGLKDVAQRTTFLVDETGLIKNVWRYESGELPDLDVWLAACRELRPSRKSNRYRSPFLGCPPIGFRLFSPYTWRSGHAY